MLLTSKFVHETDNQLHKSKWTLFYTPNSPGLFPLWNQRKILAPWQGGEVGCWPTSTGEGLSLPPPKGVEPSPDVVKVLIHFQMTGKDTKILPLRFANRPLSRLMFTTDSGTSWSCRKSDGAEPTSKCKALTYPEPKVNSLDDLGESLNFSGLSFSHLLNEVVELHDP